MGRMPIRLCALLHLFILPTLTPCETCLDTLCSRWSICCRFADDGPDATFGHTHGSEEGAISRAKRMMAEAAAAHPSHAYFTDGNIARR